MSHNTLCLGSLGAGIPVSRGPSGPAREAVGQLQDAGVQHGWRVTPQLKVKVAVVWVVLVKLQDAWPQLLLEQLHILEGRDRVLAPCAV